MAAKEQCTMYPVLLGVPEVVEMLSCKEEAFKLEFEGFLVKLYFNRETCFYREFSKQPHIAGSPRQRELANKLAANWTAFGFDKVEKPQYQVLLSFPQPDKPNRVTIVESDKVIYDITGKIKVCRLRCLVKKIPVLLKPSSIGNSKATSLSVAKMSTATLGPGKQSCLNVF